MCALNPIIWMKKASLSIPATTSLPPTKTQKVPPGCNFRPIDFLKILLTTSNLFCVIIYYGENNSKKLCENNFLLTKTRLNYIAFSFFVCLQSKMLQDETVFRAGPKKMNKTSPKATLQKEEHQRLVRCAVSICSMPDACLATRIWAGRTSTNKHTATRASFAFQRVHCSGACSVWTQLKIHITHALLVQKAAAYAHTRNVCTSPSMHLLRCVCGAVAPVEILPLYFLWRAQRFPSLVSKKSARGFSCVRFYWNAHHPLKSGRFQGAFFPFNNARLKSEKCC